MPTSRCRPATAALLAAAGLALAATTAPAQSDPLAGSMPAVQESAEASGAALTTLIKALDGDSYVVVRLQGTFGEEITALGVRNVLSHAKRVGVDHIVWIVDSPGGLVLSGEAVARQLQEFEDTFTYHAVIKKAISATMWMVAECDHLWYTDVGTAGAAVAFTKTSATGSYEVDAKFNAARSAELATRAERKGHPGLLFQAMVVRENEVWTWTDGEGHRRFEPFKPEVDPSPDDLWHLDTKETVLALTAGEMERLGFAREVTEENIEGLLGSTAFDAEGRIRSGAERVKRLRESLASLEEQISSKMDSVATLVDRLPLVATEAQDADPRNLTLFYYESGMLLTPGSRKAWVEATDRSMRKWREYQGILKAIHDAEAAYAALVGRCNARREQTYASLYWSVPEDQVPDDLADNGILDTLWRDAEQSIERLRRSRDRRRADDPE